MPSAISAALRSPGGVLRGRFVRRARLACHQGAGGRWMFPSPSCQLVSFHTDGHAPIA